MTPEDWRLVTAVFHDALARDRPPAGPSSTTPVKAATRRARKSIRRRPPTTTLARSATRRSRFHPPRRIQRAHTTSRATSLRSEPGRDRHGGTRSGWSVAGTAAVVAAFAYAGWLIVASGGVATSLVCSSARRPAATTWRPSGPTDRPRVAEDGRPHRERQRPASAGQRRHASGPPQPRRGRHVPHDRRAQLARHLSFRLTAVPGPNALLRS